MKVYLIRHGKTKGNEERRYIGSTDESLSINGREELKHHRYPLADYIYISPMKRCMETADLIYPDQAKIICHELRETDFGSFEGKNYEELKENKKYQTWLASNGTLPFPEGEDQAGFRRRCIKGFETILENHMNENRKGDIAFVVHGGTIMAIMEHFGRPKKGYYDWQIKNGEWIEAQFMLNSGKMYLHYESKK